MKKITIYIIIAVLTAACSAGVVNEKPTNETKKIAISDSLILSKKAESHFIKGNIADMKGNYAEAILEYQESLEFDSAAGIHYAISKDFVKLNKLSKALQHAKSAVNISPDHVGYNILLAKIYSIARNVDSAAIYYEKVINLDSNNYQAYYNLGQIYEATKPLQALETYQKLIELTGPEWNVLLKIADLNERIGNIDETISTVEELLNLDPSNLKLQKLMIESYIKTERYEEALSLIDDALAIFPNDISLIEFKANALIRTENWEEGSKEYLKIINKDNVSFDSKMRIASAFIAETADDSSLINITKNVLHEIKKDSSNWQVNAFLGEIASREDNDSLAIEYFKSAVELGEWNSQIWDRLGVLLFDSQRYDEAIEKMGEAVGKFPDSFVANIILGLSYSQNNMHVEAEPALKKALQLNPNDLTALHAYGFTLNQLQKQSEAIEYLNKALSIEPENIQILSTLGLIYDSLEDYENSDALYEKALAMDSTDALVMNNYAYSLAERGVKLDRAEEMSKLALEKFPENSSYLDTMGWIKYKLGEYGEAKTYIEKAMEIDEANPTLIDHLADVYFKLGDKDKAIELWNKALELDNSLEDVKQKLMQAKS